MILHRADLHYAFWMTVKTAFSSLSNRIVCFLHLVDVGYMGYLAPIPHPVVSMTLLEYACSVPAVTDKDGAVIAAEHTITQVIIGPEYDETKDYVPRSDRPEWVTVGLMGQVLVRDDGICQVNSYCSVSSLGIATASSTGYRIMKWTATNQIFIF